jgi:MoxR-like ATPase
MTVTALPPTAHPVSIALNSVLDEVSSIFLERRSAIESALIAVLAKQHWFGLGQPGTGKSDMIREIVGRFDGATYFETIMSKTRPDAAILGPYNLPELRDKGDFHRKINGFLPTANFAFLDEIGKMSPTLGHDMLAILNERLYHEVNGGRTAKHVPLYTAFAASNELIVEESEDAAALWDRLLVRVLVEYIQESGNFAALLQSAISTNDLRLTAHKTTIPFLDLQDVIDNVVPAIDVPVDAIEAMMKLRDTLRSDAEITVSDRRWRTCVRMLQASAFFAGRTEVKEDDLHVLRYCLWEVPTQITAVERITLSLSNPVAEKAMAILDTADDIARNIRDRKGQSLEVRASYGSEANQKLKVLVSELAQAMQECKAAGRSTARLDEVASRLMVVRTSVYTDCLDMPAEDVILR